MFLVYHLLQSPDLSPATSMIAWRRGSNANRTLSSERPLEPGRSSVMFLCREPWMVSTMGRPDDGPNSARISSAATTCS